MRLLSIYILVQEFYAIEAIVAMLSGTQDNNFEPMRHSHSRWYRDFNNFRNEYITKFASAIFDYTVLVVAAELRHCKKWASQYLKEYYTAELSRDEVYMDCSAYDARDILKAGIRMFDAGLVLWNSHYGGDKWKQIAKAGLMKGKVSDCVFIDHCVDLSHNNSIYFDKQARIFDLHDLFVYKQFLDLKRCCKPKALIEEKQGLRFNQLLQRANNLNIIKVRATEAYHLSVRDENESVLLDYRPVKWGSMRLDYSESNIVIKKYFNARARPEKDCISDREYAKCA